MAKLPNEGAQAIRDGYEQAVNVIRGITDPLERAEACDLASVAAAGIQVELKAFRAEAFREARQTMTVDEVAAAAGITRARVYQILDGR